MMSPVMAIRGSCFDNLSLSESQQNYILYWPLDKVLKIEFVVGLITSQILILV